MRRAALVFVVIAFIQAIFSARPGDFSKLSPDDQSVGKPLSLTLSWAASSGAVRYEICVSSNDPPICNEPWQEVGAATSLALTNLTSDTLYFWQVRAVGADASLTYANGAGAFWSFRTAAAPKSFLKTSPYDGEGNVSTSPTLSWGASNGALRYEYCYDDSNDDVCATWIDVALQRSTVLGGLLPKTTYYWQVRASGVGGITYANTGPIDFWSFTTQSTPPGAFAKSSPANTASGVATNPTLTWEASSGAAQYRYCFDTSDDQTCSTWLTAGTNTSAALSGLSQGVTYYWQVQAINAGGTTYANGSATDFWSFTTQPAALPGAFAKSSPANTASGVAVNPTLSWGASSGASQYKYCFDTSDDQACSTWLTTGTNTSAALSGLSQGVTYYWQAQAINVGGTTYANGSAANFWSFTTQFALPGAFNQGAPLDGATGISTAPTLAWGASQNASSYEYCLAVSDAQACANWISTGANTQVTLSGLGGSTTYYWQVRANGPGGVIYAGGSPAAFWRFTTLEAPPATFSKSAPADGSAGAALNPILKWNASQGATRYELCFDAANDNACSNWMEVGANIQASLTGLAYVTAYYWQVRAIGPGGITYANGGPEVFWRFTTLAAPPGAFDKSSPGDGLSNLANGLALQWQPSSGATSYAYCYDMTNDYTCSDWINAGANTGVTLNELSNGATYYWQVHANGPGGTTYANGSPTAFWSFTTLLALPGGFHKTFPSDGASGAPRDLNLIWNASSGAASYEICLDTVADQTCSSGWVSVGKSASLQRTGLAPQTTYFWQVRALSPAGVVYADDESWWRFTTADTAAAQWRTYLPLIVLAAP